MHIGVIAPPESFHTQKWVAGLCAAGADVTTFSFTPGQVPGVNAVQVMPRFTHKGELTYLSYLTGGKRLKSALEAHQVDIVNPLNVTPFGVWALQSGVRPLVNVAMGADILEYPPERSMAIADSRRWESQGESSSRLQKLTGQAKWHGFRFWVNKALHASDLITGDNLQLVHAVRDWFGVPAERVKLNRWGIEPELFGSSIEVQAQLREMLELKPGQPLVLSPRGVKPVYQADIILEAFETLLKEGKTDAKLVVLSTGYQSAPGLHEQASRLHKAYADFHYQTELIPREWMSQLWLMTDAFVNIPAYDGFSNALNEGRYASAIPILNDIPAHREIAEEGSHALYVKPLTSEKLAQKISEALVALPELRPRIATANRSWVETHAMFAHNMAHLVTRMENLLK